MLTWCPDAGSGPVCLAAFPHGEHDHRELPREGDPCPSATAALLDVRNPRSKLRSGIAPLHELLAGRYEQRSRSLVSHLRDPADPAGLARLTKRRLQPKVGADRFGTREPMRFADGRIKGQGADRADPRDLHHPPANLDD